MKKLFFWMSAAVLAIPVLLLVWGFALPAQFRETFLGELSAKRALLKADSGRPRIILVGGSAAAFGVDCALLAQELPDYQPVNFGLYAALGTRVMLDLSQDDVRAGDIVIVMPEQQAQALSDYLGAQEMWQAADGDFSALTRLHWRDASAMLGQFPRFAGSKLRYFVTGTPEGVGVYRRASFDGYGSIASGLCAANTMPEGYDPTTPILFDPSLPDEAFCDALNAYTDALTARGAAVWYHFPPMNALAVENPDGMDAYAAALQARLHAPLAGNPNACVMEGGWFYDTNFHLNSSGRTVFTRQLVRDVKAMLGDTSPTEIALPAMPSPAAQDAGTQAADSTDAACFTFEARTDADGLRLTGLTDAGRAADALTVPAAIDGQPVTALSAGMFAGAGALRTVTIQQNITALPDALFAGCPALQEVLLLHADPAALLAGNELLSGAPDALTLLVPQDSYTDYCLNYTWSRYAARLGVSAAQEPPS